MKQEEPGLSPSKLQGMAMGLGHTSAFRRETSNLCIILLPPISHDARHVSRRVVSSSGHDDYAYLGAEWLGVPRSE